MAGGFELGNLYGPFPPKPFYDSMILNHIKNLLATDSAAHMQVSNATLYIQVGLAKHWRVIDGEYTKRVLRFSVAATGDQKAHDKDCFI